MRPQQRVVELEPLPLEAHRFVPGTHERAYHLHRLLEDREALPDGSERHTERSELILVPAGADPQLEPADRVQRQRGRHLREDRRVPERRTRDERPDPDARRRNRERRERRHRLERALAVGRSSVAFQRQEEVVGDPDGVVAEPLGRDGELHHARHRDGPLPGEGEVVVGKREPEPHYRYRRTSAGPVMSVFSGTVSPIGIFSRGYTEMFPVIRTPG